MKRMILTGTLALATGFSSAPDGAGKKQCAAAAAAQQQQQGQPR